MIRPLYSLLKREIRLNIRQGAGLSLSLIFFLSFIVIFPFGVGPNKATLSLLASAILWAGALLSVLMGLEKIFQTDEEDGTLDLLRMSPYPFEYIIFMKILAYWLCHALPLIIATPLFSLMLGLDGAAMIGVALSLILGTPILVFIGVICAALTLKLRRAGSLLVVLAIPFLIPTLIFSLSIANDWDQGMDKIKGPLFIIASLLVFTSVLSIFATAQILRRK